MTKPKLCPMTFGSVNANPFEFNCIKEECEWWIPREEGHGKSGCAIKILALQMEILVSSRKRYMGLLGKPR